jgi:hypothetical protein
MPVHQTHLLLPEGVYGLYDDSPKMESKWREIGFLKGDTWCKLDELQLQPVINSKKLLRHGMKPG